MVFSSVFRFGQRFDYVDRFGLDGPCDDIGEVLPRVAKRIGSLLPGGGYDLEKAARFMIAKYREGSLGKFQLVPL